MDLLWLHTEEPKDGKLQDQIDYLTADEENGHIIAQARIEMDRDTIVQEHVSARSNGENIIAKPSEIDYIDAWSSSTNSFCNYKFCSIP